jgi:hypothetical protein
MKLTYWKNASSETVKLKIYLGVGYTTEEIPPGAIEAIAGLTDEDVKALAPQLEKVDVSISENMKPGESRLEALSAHDLAKEVVATPKRSQPKHLAEYHARKKAEREEQSTASQAETSEVQ